jgi:hypothetical protein
MLSYQLIKRRRSILITSQLRKGSLFMGWGGGGKIECELFSICVKGGAGKTFIRSVSGGSIKFHSIDIKKMI